MADQAVPGPGESQVDITCYPPLGQVTKIAAPNLKFSCILGADKKYAGQSWQVVLRFAPIGSDEWKESSLRPSNGASLFKGQVQPNAESMQLLLGTEIHVTAAVRFQLRFRRGPEESWITAGKDPNLDSIVIHASETFGPGKSLRLDDYMEALNPDLRSGILDNGSESDIISWLVEAPVEAAQKEVPHMTQVMFGSPFGGRFLRWFATSRNTTSWMAPCHGRTYFKLDVAAILCSFLNSRGEHLVILGISGFENVMAIFGDNNEGSMMIKMRNEREAPGFGGVVVSLGTDLEATLASAVDQARAIFRPIDGPKDPMIGDYGGKSDPLWADRWINGLIYSPKIDARDNTSEDEIVESLQALAAKGIAISGLMLGDVWQKVDDNTPSQYHAGLMDFEADPAVFKTGLKHTVAKIKGQFKSVRHFIVGCTIFGHWGGVSEHPEGSMNQNYETVHVKRLEAIHPGPKTELNLPLVSPRDARRFFNDYYQFLSSCDISAVQVNGFYMLETLTSAYDRCSLAECYLDAQSSASLENFPAGVLVCMSLSPSALFNNLKLPARKEVVRNSGFFPEHGKHVFNNAINALLSGTIGNIPDWGPVQSTEYHGDFHVAARSISGGPIQVDSFDSSILADLELVKKVSGFTANEKTVVFRPTGVGRTVDPYVGFEDNVLLKVANIHDVGTSAISILGIFNSSEHAISELVHINEFRGLDASKEYIVKSSSGLFSDHVSVDGPFLVSVYLKALRYEFLCAYPLEILTNTRNEEKVAVATLGLHGKMLGAAAIVDSASSIEDGVVCVKAVLKALGVLEFYISDLPQRSINEKTCQVKVQGKAISPGTHTIKSEGQILSLDLVSIWRDYKMESSVDEIYSELQLA